ncbi:MAG: sulfatase-like hydrolase/transferase [Pseudomonadota bacterium]
MTDHVKPNLLIILSDEHQARAMGCADHDFVKTPNLDALAMRGTRFTKAYTPSPICVPARAAFATGQYVHQNRLWDNAMPYTGELPGWGHALQKKRVPVESIGKLHYRQASDEDGFDVKHIPMMVVDGVGMVWASMRKENERVSPKSRMLGDYIGPGTSRYTEYDSAVTDQAVAWLHDRPHGETPWCLYVGLVAPHFPLAVPDEYFNMYPTDALPKVKLHPRDGHKRHPWVELQNAVMDSESRFKDADERLTAMACYYGLCSWMDHNVGRILGALEASGLADNTTVVYSSDHGDNVGARGLWGKSNHYEESVAVPMIVSGPNIPAGTCETPCSLLDLSATIVDHFDADPLENSPGVSLYDLLGQPDCPERIVFSEYHAAGAVSGAFMLRKGDWKLIHYVGFEPELFNLRDDPEELVNLAAEPTHEQTLNDLRAALHAICDPQAIDALAHADQADLIASYGGREAALTLGAPGATPPPRIA